MYVDADMIKLKELVEKLNSAVKLYKEYINEYFVNIKNIPSITYAWKGNVAQSYVDLVASREVKYIDFGESLQEYTDLISNSVDNLSGAINNSQLNGGIHE